MVCSALSATKVNINPIFPGRARLTLLSVKISSTKLPLKKTAKVASTGLAAGLASQGLAQVVDSVILETASSLTRSQSAVDLSSIGWLGGLSQNSEFVAATSGLTATTAIAAGMVFGQEKISLQDQSLWKRLLFSGPARAFNQGITFRQASKKAQRMTSRTERFQAGMQAGWNVGGFVGGTVGKIQGSLTGATLGWQHSGHALKLMESALQGTPLPRPLQSLMPLAVGTSCLILGQMAGSAVGGLLGKAVGGVAVGLGHGTYAALRPSPGNPQR